MSQAPPAWLVRTGRPAPARPKPHLGPVGLPARPLTLDPRDGPTSGASVATLRPPCAVRAAGGASCAHALSRPNARVACSGRHVRTATCSHRNRPTGLDSGRLGSAWWQRSGGLNTCGARQAGLCESGEARLRGWCNVRPVTRTFVRVSRWLDACMCICMSAFEMQKRTSLGQPLRAAERTATARTVFERRRRR